MENEKSKNCVKRILEDVNGVYAFFDEKEKFNVIHCSFKCNIRKKGIERNG